MNCYCINLDKRTDNWEMVQGEAKKLSLDPIRYAATWRKRGHDGCKISHMSLLEKVKDEGEFMIIEDDMLLCVDNAEELMQDAYSQLPEDWDMFYLGATLNEPIERYSDNLYRLKHAWATHAIIYNNQNGVVDYILKNHNHPKFSVFLAWDVQYKFNCFITNPMIATQRSGYSDILRHHVDYKVIEKRYKKYAR